MIYVLSIDWLSVYGVYNGDGDTWRPVDDTMFSYKRENFGTRCFSVFHRVRIINPEGGWDEFAEVQSVPYSSILPPYAMIIRFVNRVLYMPNFWDLVERFLSGNLIDLRGISRIDICADFNQFATIDPRALIEGFAAKKYRHIGRGIGSLGFNHGVINGDYGVNYTGLTFGTHASDAHVYLYDKSFCSLREPLSAEFRKGCPIHTSFSYTCSFHCCCKKLPIVFSLMSTTFPLSRSSTCPAEYSQTFHLRMSVPPGTLRSE